MREEDHLGPNACSAGFLNLLAAAEKSVHDQGACHLLLIEETLDQTLQVQRRRITLMKKNSVYTCDMSAQWLFAAGPDCRQQITQKRSGQWQGPYHHRESAGFQDLLAKLNTCQGSQKKDQSAWNSFPVHASKLLLRPLTHKLNAAAKPESMHISVMRVVQQETLLDFSVDSNSQKKNEVKGSCSMSKRTSAATDCSARVPWCSMASRGCSPPRRSTSCTAPGCCATSRPTAAPAAATSGLFEAPACLKLLLISLTSLPSLCAIAWSCNVTDRSSNKQ